MQQASRKLREAAALGHDNTDVQEAFLVLHDGTASSPLVDLCRRYAQYHDPRAGEDAVEFLRSSETSNLGSAALECLEMILETNTTTLSEAQDVIIAQLARLSSDVRKYFTSELDASTTEFFDNVYVRGDKAANCLRTVVLDPALWTSEETRLRVEDDLFQLFLAKLMESGHDHDGRALKGIALLLLADTERLHYFIDDVAAEALLTSLDFRLPADVRGQATLVYSKFLEVAEPVAQTFFANFITKHVSKERGDDLILAFAAGAALFPVVPTNVAQVFLTEGFLAGIMPLLHRQFVSTRVHDSFLALLNAACIDAACRNAIMQNCGPWLSHLVSNGSAKQPAMAATILTKIRTSGLKGSDQRANKADEDVSDLVDLFKTTFTTEETSNVSDSIEGLAYASLKPDVKEQLVSDQAFSKSLLRALESNPDQPEIVIGGLSIIQNITHYSPNLSEEQKRITQLKAYANASRPTDPSPLENDEHVRARCSKVVEAGAVPVLVKINKIGSPSTAHLIDQIMLSLAKDSKNRGKMAQQGAVKVLIAHALKTQQTPVEGSIRLQRMKLGGIHQSVDAPHALARILISLNPSLVFPSSNTPHITDAVASLVKILQPPTDEGPSLVSDAPRDLLPVFETLLALTNLASSPDQSAANAIIRLAWDQIEDLLLGANNMLRRAATELICNLVAFPAGIGRFADGSKRASERLRILVAMADVNDTKTRSAAGGALAMITDFEPILKSMLDAEDKGKRTLEIVLDLATDTDVGLAHRGLATLANFVNAEGNPGQQSQDVLRSLNGAEKIKASLTHVREPGVLQIGVDVLKKLQS